MKTSCKGHGASGEADVERSLFVTVDCESTTSNRDKTTDRNNYSLGALPMGTAPVRSSFRTA